MHKSELTVCFAHDNSGREQEALPFTRSCLHLPCDRFPFVCGEALPDGDWG